MVRAMIKEIELRKDFLDSQSVETIYFGGGTPSVLTTGQIKSLLEKVHESFEVIPGAEITI